MWEPITKQQRCPLSVSDSPPQVTVCWHFGSGLCKTGHQAASQTGPGMYKELDLVLSYDLLDLTLNRMWFPRYKVVASAAIPEPQLGCDLSIKIEPDILSFIIFN